MRKYGIAGSSKMRRTAKTANSFCMNSSVMALSVVAFGHHDPQTSRCVTYFYEDFLKEESKVKTQESWRTLNLTLNRVLLALINKLFENLQDTL
jgi:hypothetical protein